jgi:PST family polysaccharide transporter
LLQPSDFGVVGLAYSVTSVVGTLVSFGIDDVLLSRQRRIKVWVGPALWLNLALALVGTLITLAAAPLAVMIYKNAEIGYLIYILASSVPFLALSIVPGVIIQAELKFRFLAIYATTELVGIQLITVILAFSGFGAYSFVIPVPIAAAIKAIVYWRAARTPLKWRVRPALWRYLLSASFTVFGQRLFVEIRNNADRIVLGFLADPAVVGLYFFASKLAAVPVYTLASSLNRVLLPTLAHLRKDPGRQLAATLSASRIMAIGILPLSFLQAVLAKPALHILFGEKWIGAVPIVEILSVALAFDVLPCVVGTFVSANGKFRFQLGWTILSLPLFLGLISIGGTIASAQGVAWGIAAFYCIMAPAYTYSALRPFGCTFVSVLETYRVPVISSLLAIGPAAMLLQLPYFRSHDLLAVVVITILSGATFPLFVRLVSPETFREIKMRISAISFVRPQNPAIAARHSPRDRIV